MMDEELNKKVLSRMKTNLKISWTKRTNKLNELIKNEANEFAVQSQLDLIDEKLTERRIQESNNQECGSKTKKG